MNRVLFVTYYFPPSGGPGVQRPLKFVRYLREFGWEPVVLTVDPERAAWPAEDPGQIEQIPAGTEVIRTRSRDPYALYARLTGRSRKEAVNVGFVDEEDPGFRERFARWIRANLYLPDARRGWVPYATGAARSRLDGGDIDAVFTTGPPQSAHLIGRSVRSMSGLPWIADLRDLWPDPLYVDELPMTGWARRRDAAIRNRTLGAADRIVVVRESMAPIVHEQIGHPVDVLPNGFDPADFEDVVPVRHDGFTLVHAGTMSRARNPDILWRVLSRGREQDRWPDLQILFVGPMDAFVRSNIRDHGLGECVRTVPYVPHSEAMAYLLGADTLLLLKNRIPGAGDIVPGKLYEYLGAGRPILCIGPPEGEPAKIIDAAGAGSTVDFDDAGSLEDRLSALYDAWSSGRPISGADPARIRQYSRKEQTRSLALMLDRLTDRS